MTSHYHELLTGDRNVPAVASAATDAQQVIDVLLGPLVRIIGIVLAAMLARWLLHRAISSLVAQAIALSVHERLDAAGATGRLLLDAGGGLLAERRRQRLQTMGSALRSLASIGVFAVALGTILGELGVNLGPLLASAGILGAALAFGAQNLVRDVLSGAFLILEDQYGVGDQIDLQTVAGTVEGVGLRVTQLRDEQGVLWYVRNGEVLRVGNRSQGWATVPVDVPVAYDEDLDRVNAVLARAGAQLAGDPGWAGRVLDVPEVAGVQALAPDAVTVRLLVKCAPTERETVPRELRRRVKAALDAAGIKVAAAAATATEPPPAPR